MDSNKDAKFFDDDSLAVTSAKLSAAEAFLHLGARDISFTEFSRELVKAVVKIIPCEAASLFEVDRVTNELFFRAAIGQAAELVSEFRIPIGHGIVGYVAESCQPLLTSDATESKLHLKEIGDAVQFETRNVLAAPIIIREKVFGVLELINRVGEPTFAPADLELFTYITGLMSKAIELRLMLAWAKRAA